MRKRVPKFKSNKDVERFLNKDLSDYLTPGNLHPATFEFAPKSKVVNLRISEELLTMVKKIAKQRGIPYQRYIREAVEMSVRKSG